MNVGSRGPKLHWLSYPLIYLMGMLYNSAVVNVGNSGIPLYVVAVLMMAASILWRARGIKRDEAFLIGSCVLALVLTTAVHVLSDTHSSSEFTQLGSRIFYLVSFAVCAQFVRLADPEGRSFLRALRWLTVCYVLVGFHEYWAKLSGSTGLVEWVANNQSYKVAAGLNGGWLGESSARIRTFWAEPSASVLPVMLSLYFLLTGRLFGTRFGNVLWTLLVLCYAYLTGSRNVYFVVIFLFAAFIYIRGCAKFGRRWVVPGMRFGFLMIIVFAFTWQLAVGFYFDDLSAAGRASSVRVGIGVWLQNFAFGTGFNTFEAQSFKYGMSGGGITTESIIQSSFLANLQQAGLIGTLAVFAPLMFAIRKTKERWLEVGPLWLCLLAVCGISAGMEFSSMFWLVSAVMLAVRPAVQGPFGAGQSNAMRRA